MKVAAVVIGVDNTGELTPLSGAASGARKFADWASEQEDIDLVSTLTDSEGKVQLNDILSVIESIVKSRTYSKLIVFFAGHGFLHGPQTELWLLSDAPSRGSEAINVQLSRDYARYSGIPHVIFISDACRSGGSNHSHRSVQGAAIFPVPKNWDSDGEVDTFYGTRPGDPALEFNDSQSAVKNYKGIFTECLIDALYGKVPEVVTSEKVNGRNRFLVLSRALKNFLRKEVPNRAAKISIKLQQEPEVRVESHPPNFFAELSNVKIIGERYFFVDKKVISRRAVPKGVFAETVTLINENEENSTNSTAEFDRQLDRQASEIIAAQEHENFEISCGFVIYDKIRSVTTGGGLVVDVIYGDGLTRVDVHTTNIKLGNSILLELENGAGSVLAVIPEHIGTVLVDDGKVVNVTYMPSTNKKSFKDHLIETKGSHFDRQRAYAAVASRNGFFNLSEEVTKYYSRALGKYDPILDVYDAYAYNNSGQVVKVQNMLQSMTKATVPVMPFDVALLARTGWPETVTPFCPLLRQGWALLDFHPQSAEILKELRLMLLPGLWTMFTPEGVEMVKIKLTNGEFK